MRFTLPGLVAVTALSSAGHALSPQDISADLPLSALLISAQTHLARGDTTEALVFYDAAVAKDPKNYLTLFKRATTYLSLGRSSQATDDFNKVLSLQPGFQGAHLQLAKIKSRLADWDAARASYIASGRGEDSPEVVELVEAKGAAFSAESAHEAQNWDDCVNYASIAILVATRSPSLRDLRAQCRFQRGEIEEGMGDLHHVLQLRPGDIAPHIIISATTFYGLGDLENGLSQVRKCLHSDPDSKVCQNLHRQQKAIRKAYTRAEAQLKKSQTTSAGRTLVGTVEEPGLITLVREQEEQLRKDGRIPLRAKAGLHDMVVDMVCHAYSESNHRDARKYCDEALSSDPDSFWGLVYRGKALLKKEDFEAAIQTLEKAAQVRPDKQDKINPILNKAQISLKRSKTKDYYKVLGVPNDADQKQIKSAYRKASKQYHPDKAVNRGIDKNEAEKKMASINEAYEVLSDTELRARFDRGDDPNSQERANPFEGSPFGGSHPFMFHQEGGPQANFKFHFGGGGGPFGF